MEKQTRQIKNKTQKNFRNLHPLNCFFFLLLFIFIYFIFILDNTCKTEELAFTDFE